MFDVLSRAIRSLIVQYLRQAARVLEFARLFIRRVEHRQLKAPALSRRIGIRVRDGDGISLTGNVSLRRGDGDRSGAGIGRDVTLGASFRFFAGSAGVARWWPSGKGVHRLRGAISRKEKAKAGSQQRRQND